MVLVNSLIDDFFDLLEDFLSLIALAKFRPRIPSVQECKYKSEFDHVNGEDFVGHWSTVIDNVITSTTTTTTTTTVKVDGFVKEDVTTEVTETIQKLKVCLLGIYYMLIIVI
jgi:hypothetical protein